MSKKSPDRSRSERAAVSINAQKAAERNRFLAIGGVVLFVVVLAVVVMAVVIGMNSKPSENQKATPSIATGAADGTPAELKGYGVFLGDADAPKTVTIYEDLQCPACANFEAVVGKPLTAAMEAGDIRLEYRMVGILDRASTNDYSSRALNAALAVLDTAGVEAFGKFHDDLYASQPAEGGPGFEDDELIDRAVAAGADKDKISKQIKDKVYAQWILKANDAMSREGYGRTPTVLVDGTEVEQDKVLEEIQ